MNLNATANKDKGSTEFSLMPVGLYNGQVLEASSKVSKNGKEYIEIVYGNLVQEGNPNTKEFYKNKVYETFFAHVDFRMGDFYKLGRICGLTDAELSSINETTLVRLKGHTLKVRVVQEIRQDNNEKVNKVQGGQYFEYSGGVRPPELPNVGAVGASQPPVSQTTVLPFQQ